MEVSPLSRFLSGLRSQIEGGLQGRAKATATLRVRAVDSPGGLVSFVPRTSSDTELASSDDHTLVLEFEVGKTRYAADPQIIPVVTGAGSANESPSGTGDEDTLRRRLELVLGGRPGFNTGAKAEVLADLLEEFGRAALVGILRRDWISQFDTGPDASPSVVKAPSANGSGQ